MDPVEDLLFEVLDRPDSEWSAAVEAACATHPEHATELRRRFGMLAQNGVADPASTHPGLDGVLPERFGPYRLLQRLGGGGMGVVYQARHEGLGRDVALKLVRPELLYFEGSRARFAREVEAVARLQHPGCVQIHQVGDEHGVPYFAMELVAGVSFEQLLTGLRSLAQSPTTIAKLVSTDVLRLLRASAPSDSPSDTSDLFVGGWPRMAVRLCLAAAEALAHAHTRGVVHRDIKPSNLMLTPVGRVVVIDFGLALADGASRVTRSGTLLGSLPYMAPEQIRGDHAAIDARTDVHALGVCLYELLSLTSPFESPHPEQTRLRITTGQVGPLRAHNPAVDTDLATVCARAMEVDPQRRYQTMHAFAADLAALLEHRAIAARPASLFRQATRWARRRPALATAALLILLGLVFGPLVVSLAVAGQRDRAVQAERLARNGEYAANLLAANLAIATGNGTMARQRLDACPPDLRGFEWRHLDGAMDASLLTVQTDLRELAVVALSADASVWAAGSSSGEVAVFDGLSGQSRRSWRASDKAIGAMQLSGDGATLFVVDAQQHLRVFDCATGALLRDRAPWSSLDRLALGPAARSIVCALGPGRYVTFDPMTLAVRNEIELDPTQAWPGEVFQANEQQIVAPLSMGGLGVWSMSTGKLLARSKASGLGRRVMMTPDGDRFAAFDHETRLTWWDRATGALQPLDVGVFVVSCGVLTHDGRRLLAGCASGELLVFDLGGGHIERRLLGHRSLVAVAVSANGLALTAGGDGKLRLYGILAEPHALDLPGAGWGGALTAVGRHLWTGGRDSVVRAVDVTTGESRWRVALPHWINALVLSEAEGCLVATYHGVLQLLDPNTGAERASIDLPPIGPVTRMAVDASGRRVACLGQRGQLVIVDLAARRTGQPVAVVGDFDELEFGALTWDVGHDRVLVAGAEPEICVVDPTSAQISARWSTDGFVATMLAEGEVLWTSEVAASPRHALLRRRRTTDGRVEQERDTPMGGLALARLERRVVVGRIDGHISFHDEATLEPLLELREEGEWLWNLVASRDGDWLALQRYPRDPRVLFGRRLVRDPATERERAQRSFAADLATDAASGVPTWLVQRRIEERADLDPKVRAAARAALPPASAWDACMKALLPCLTSDIAEVARERLVEFRTALVELPVEVPADHRLLVATVTGLLELRLGNTRAALEAVARDVSDKSSEWRLLSAARLFVRAAAHYQLGDLDAAVRAHAELRALAGQHDSEDWPVAGLLRELEVWSRR